MSNRNIPQAAIVSAQAILRNQSSMSFGPFEDELTAGGRHRQVAIDEKDFAGKGKEVAEALVALLEKAGGRRGDTVETSYVGRNDLHIISADPGVIEEARRMARGHEIGNS